MSPTAKKKATIIRVGDRVKIVNPDFFIRCGYPKSPETEMEVVKEKYAAQIHEMICSDERSFLKNDIRLFEKVCREIAYARLKKTGFGGSERKIYTEIHEGLKDKIFHVIDITFCMTGLYYPPSGGGGYYEYDEYEPGGLEDTKTHKILHLIPYSYTLKIEATNVEKIQEKEEEPSGAYQKQLRGIPFCRK